MSIPVGLSATKQRSLLCHLSTAIVLTTRFAVYLATGAV